MLVIIGLVLIAVSIFVGLFLIRGFYSQVDWIDSEFYRRENEKRTAKLVDKEV